MPRFFNISHYLLLLPVVFLYSNCGGYQAAENRLSSLAQCENSAKLSLKLLEFNPQSHCQQIKRINCERRVFRPDRQEKVRVEKECLTHSAFGENCFDVKERVYNTTGASDQAEDYHPGASYNYQEVNCYLEGFTHLGRPIIQSSAPHLTASLDQLRAHCLNGGDL